VSAGGTTTGDAWRFTTQIAPPGKATTPSPANLATGANRDVDLSWTAGGGATSHKVYFGTTSPGTFRVSQTGTSFDPGTLAAATTYYWRIDETNAGGTTTGDVWRFTTAAKPGDTDGDGDVDPADYSFFLLCCQGPGTPVSAGCAKVDFDADTDVDLIDFGVFQACFNGTGRSPACAD
jgi:hypothetical protein